MEKHKKVQEKKELFLQFSEEEMQEMGWEEGQKISLDLDEDTGAITLKPFVKMEIDIGEWPRETLEFLVGESCDRDVSVNEIINEVLLDSINKNDK
jgi:bifunctional DNA-binding transcriptional regulator/antitoxin component of YhaV-PrlF toxin-antitoxin module